MLTTVEIRDRLAGELDKSYLPNELLPSDSLLTFFQIWSCVCRISRIRCVWQGTRHKCPELGSFFSESQHVTEFPETQSEVLCEYSRRKIARPGKASSRCIDP